MLEQERHETILRLLKRSRIATIHDFVSVLGVSEATVRRDFAVLEGRQMLQRIRGGAKLLATSEDVRRNDGPEIFDESPFALRKNTNIDLKRKIAKQAMMLCRDGETIIIDGGSTTYQMVEFLPALRLQVITNSFAIAEYLIRHSECEVIVPQGRVHRDSQLILNPFHEDTFKDYSAVKCFMGAEAIDERGAANTNALVIQAERSMIEHSRDLVLLVDSSKFTRRGHLRLCTFDQITTVISDTGISAENRQMIASHGIDLRIV